MDIREKYLNHWHKKELSTCEIDLCQQANEALEARHGRKYSVGCGPCILYVASGTATDWVAADLGVQVSLGFEVRGGGGKGGKSGFVLPEEEIVPLGEIYKTNNAIKGVSFFHIFRSSFRVYRRGGLGVPEQGLLHHPQPLSSVHIKTKLHGDFGGCRYMLQL